MTSPAELTREEAEALVYRECQLLDERQFEEWLGLFTEDGVYWLPSSDSGPPDETVSIIYDDSVQRAKRVHQLMHENHLAQTPPSRTVHLLSNLQVARDKREEDAPSPQPASGERGGEALVRCNLMVAEARPALHPAAPPGISPQRMLAGQCEYRLRYQEGRWAIVMKRVLLIDRDLPLYNLTFLI